MASIAKANQQKASRQSEKVKGARKTIQANNPNEEVVDKILEQSDLLWMMESSFAFNGYLARAKPYLETVLKYLVT